MTVKIQRGRQFLAGDATAQLFDDKGKAGSYLQQAGDKLVAQQHTILLRKGSEVVKLSTAAEWKSFLGTHAGNKDKTSEFAKNFGITFDDFCNVLDDVAASDDKGLTLNLSPRTNLARALSLDKVEGNYASTMAADAAVKLTGEGGVKSDARLVPAPTITADILSTPITDGWERDRTEQEAWADFKMGDGANGIFRRTNASAVFEKLHKPDWNDPKAMELVERFTMPMHLEIAETKPDGTVVFQDRDEMFRETYFDDANGALEKAGASVRARVRFDDNEPFTVRRVLIQGKQGRAVDEHGNSAVHKFEKRFEGTYSADENKAQELLRSGKDTDGKNLKVAALLYKSVKEQGTLSPDGNLRLEPKSLVLQKRRRSHMQFESLSDVQAKRATLKKEIDTLAAAGTAIPPALAKYDARLAEQEKFLGDAQALLSRYGQRLPANTDGFIISADRYSVYDPSARSTQPTDIDDETGRVGRGLHLEAEWDTASSDPFEKAKKAIEAKLAANPSAADKAALEADLGTLKKMSDAILKDVANAVNLMKEKMNEAGLKSDDRHLAKEERAAEFMRRPDRPIIWK
ncbi:MAG: hypothetical protein ACO1OB_29200 [Archangium sp.]